MKLREKLTIVFLIMVAVPMLVIGALGYLSAKDIMSKEILEDLKLVIKSKEGSILEHLEGKRQRVLDIASGSFFRTGIERIISIKDKEERKKAVRYFNSYLRTTKKTLDPDILEIHVYDLEGIMIASTDEETPGSDKDRGQPFFINGKKGIYIQTPFVHEHHGVKHQFVPIATPVRSTKDNSVIGVLMTGYVLDNIKNVLSGARSIELGALATAKEAGHLEFILFNNDKTMIASSKKVEAEFFNRKIETEPVLMCIDNSEEINKEWVDYNGNTVWGASACLQVEKDWRWVLVAKKTKYEALAPVRKLKNQLLIIGLITLLTVFLVAKVTANTITKPIEALHEGAEIIGSGNLDHKVGTDAGDEIGQLSRTVDRMTESLKNITASRDELTREITKRKKAENLLIEKERLLAKSQEIAHIGSWELDIVNNTLTWSDETYRIFGLTPQGFAATYEAFLEAVHPYDRKAVDDAYSGSLREGRDTYEIEHRVVLKSTGEVRFIHEKCEHIRDESGRVIRSVGMVQDITERKRAEAQLRESEEKFRRLFETAKDGLLLLDKKTGHITTVNEAITKMLGYPEKDFIGKPLGDFGILTDGESFQEILPKLEDSGFIFRKDVPLETREGKRLNTEVYLVNRATVAQCNVRDITERKLLEAFLTNILESIGEGFIVIDRDYRILIANRAFCRTVKREPEDVKGKHCYEVSHGIEIPCYEAGEECAIRHTFETGTPHECVHTHYDKEGNPIYVETKSFPMKDSYGNIDAVIEIIIDITEKRKLEDQLRHAQKMEAMGRLTGGVAHDFNNILTAIIGYGSLLQSDMAEGNSLRVYVDEILAAAERAASVTQGLLAFSRKQVIHPMLADLNEIVRRTVKLLSSLISEDIELELLLDDKPLRVIADSAQVEQVLINLATNARDAMPDGGTLSIATSRVKLDADFIKAHGYGKAGEYALITVSDTGMGMEKKTLERIFEPFFTTKEIGKGTGLGLAIVYGIIKQHDGHINVYSEPGEGTTFRIYLPLTSAAVEKAEKAMVVPLPAEGTETILIAEDDFNVRALIKTVLQRAGYGVIEAVDGEDAVRAFNDNIDSIGLFLLDVIMPKKDGREVYEEVRKINPGARVIFISGYTSDILHKKGLMDEGINFITKPVSPRALLEKIREVFDR